MAARRVLSSALRAANLGPASPIAPPVAARALVGAGDGTERRSSAGAWLLGAAAGAVTMAGAALAEGSTAIPPEGKITVQTDSGKHTVLFPAGDNEWRIKISPAVPAYEPPPKPPAMAGPVQLAPPPYSLSALEPVMTRETLETHWGKHHKTYAENANKQLAQSPELSQVAEESGVLELLKVAWNDGKPLPVYNNAAQVVNHTMFWESMRPQGGGEPPANSKLSAAIQRDFGSFKALEEELKSAALSQFGSGWAWLVCDTKGNLKVFKTSNAVNPIVTGWIPILALDVWEHAYYIEYKNRRNEYVQNFFEHLVDWDGAALRYEAAQELA